MAVDSKHPDYDRMVDDWTQVRDAMKGPREVKAKGEQHLPMPRGFLAQEDQGVRAYQSYKTRAKFPNFVAPTVRGMNGVMHRVEASIELPEGLAYLFEKATRDGITLETLHRRITSELLQTGRYSLLVDIDPTAQSKVPYLAGYSAESLINWSEDGDFFVLDESRLERTGFEWDDEESYRVLELQEGIYVQELFDETNKTATETSKLADGDSETLVVPTSLGGKALVEIPFVVIGSTDVSVNIDEIPMLGVTECAYSAYRLDADYRHQLYMSGAETLFITGAQGDELPKIVGASVIFGLPEGAKAEYVGPEGKGIEAHRTAIQDEKVAAAMEGAKLFDAEKGAAESGEALKIRFAAQTATLTTIAQSAAQGLERALKHAAVMIGADPNKVVVPPNLSFIDSTMSPQEAFELVKVWQAGGISGVTLYENLQRGDIASAERTYEEERSLIEDELPEREPVVDEPAIDPDNGDVNDEA